MRLRMLVGGIAVAVLLSACTPVAETAARNALRIQKFAAVATRAEDFRNIWGHAPSTSELNEVAAASEVAIRQGYVIPVAKGARTAADSFLELYQNSQADVVTLVGHNDAGIFKFADGSPLPLASLGSSADPPIALISCNSMLYPNGNSAGVPGKVTFEVAYATQGKLEQKLGGLDHIPSTAEIQSVLVASLEEVIREKRVKITYIVLTVTVGGGGGGIAIWQQIE